MAEEKEFPNPLEELAKQHPERKKEITEGYLVEFFRDTYDQWDSQKKAIISRMDDAWNVYNNFYDFSDKAKWQSKNFLPKFKMAVRTASAMLKRSLIQSRKFFTIEGMNDESRALEKDIETAIERIHDQSDFVIRFVESITAGLLENLINLKVFPVPMGPKDRPIHERQTYKIVVQPVTSYNLWLDPTGRNKGVIHRVVMDFSDYRKLCDQKIYEASTLAHVETDFRNKDLEYKEKLRQGLTNITKPKWRKEVELMEFWGDVDDDYGNRLFENVTFSVVNQKHVARFPVKNPYRHGAPPFIIGPVIKKPFSVWHEGFGDGVVPIAKMMVENLNTTLDGNLFATAKAFELNLDYVHNAADFKGGIYPGKVFKTRGVPPGAQALRDIQLGASSAQGLQIMAALDREFQNGSGINEFISGFGGVGKKTATEVRTKAQQSSSLIAEIAGDIEQRILEPLIEMEVDLMMEWNPEVFGPRILSVPRDKLKFKFKAHGMTDVLAKSEEAQKAMMFMNIVGKTPLVQKVNWDYVGNKVAESLNWDPNKAFVKNVTQPPGVGAGPTRPEEEQAAAGEAQNQEKMQQMLQLMK